MISRMIRRATRAVSIKPTLPRGRGPGKPSAIGSDAQTIWASARLSALYHKSRSTVNITASPSFNTCMCLLISVIGKSIYLSSLSALAAGLRGLNSQRRSALQRSDDRNGLGPRNGDGPMLSAERPGGAWSACSAAQNQICFDRCTADPDCTDGVGICAGTQLLGCNCTCL